MNILVTGGLGFIGSHTVVELIAQEHNVVILDNLSNSSIDVLDRIESIARKKPRFYEIDILDVLMMSELFASHPFDAVIHFAGVKAVGESVSDPLKYYANNVQGTLNLLHLMNKFNVKNLIFSSSATVYGAENGMPIDESGKTGPTNPYGRSKLMIEEICKDLSLSDPEWRIILLRYFNPVGAHPSGLIGESPVGIPSNLFPFIAQTAMGIRDCLYVFGNDYDTPDGTGIRDFIHVMDLAAGHVRALQAELTMGTHTFNLGTGTGYSVLEIIRAFENSNNVKINYKIVNRRAGDIAICYSNPAKADTLLNWKAKSDLDQMCKDAWNYQNKLRNKG